MIPTNTNTKCFGFFRDYAGKGVSGLSVTIDILGHDGALLVSDGGCSETLIAGLYVYPRSFSNEGLFPFKMKTTSTTVAEQEIVGIWQVDNSIWDLTHTEAGEPITITIPPPAGAYQCRVFAPCYDQASLTPIDATTATCRITAPYLYENKYHDIRTENAILSDLDEHGNRFIYWDLVWGCKVLIEIPEMGIVKRGTVPAQPSVHVSLIA